MRVSGLAAALVWATASTVSAQAPGPPPGALFYGCGTPEEVKRNAMARLSAAVPSPAERQAELTAAQAAIGKALELHRDVMAGKAVDPPYQEASRLAALAANSAAGELAELYRRVAED